jgi:hypothetical protein
MNGAEIDRLRNISKIFSLPTTPPIGRQLRHFGRCLEERPEYQRPEGAKREVLMIKGIRPQSLRCRQNERRQEHQRLPCDRAEEVDQLSHWSVQLSKQNNNRKPDQDCSDDWFKIRSCVLVRHIRLPKYAFLSSTGSSNEGRRNRQDYDLFLGKFSGQLRALKTAS